MKSKTPNTSKDQQVRIHHHRMDREYSVVANHGAENPRLSFGAKGLLWYMITRPSDFEIHTWHLAKIYIGSKRGSGINAIREFLNELKNEGYLTYKTYQNERGQWQHRYDIYPIPHSEFKEKFPDEVKPYLAEPYTVKPDVITSTELPITELDCLSCVEAAPVACLPRENIEKTVKKDCKGKDVIISKEDLYSECVLKKKNWTKQEIEEAWKVLEKYESPVRDWFLFINGTIENIRKIAKIKELKCQPKCKTKTTSKERLLTTKEKSSGKGTSVPFPANWRDWTKPSPNPS